MISKDYVLNKILDTEISDEPWRHSVIKDFLPKSLFDGIKGETLKYLDDEKLKEIHEKPKAQLVVEHLQIFLINRLTLKPDKHNNPNLYQYFEILNDDEIEKQLKKRLIYLIIMMKLYRLICGRSIFT